MCNYPSLAGIQKPVYLLLNAASQLTHCLAGFQNAEISLFRAVLVCMRLLDPCLSCSCLFSRGLPDKHEHAECTELLAGCLVLGVLCGRRRKISSTHSSFYVSFPSRARAYASVCVRAFVSILLHAGVRQCHCVCVPMYCSCCGMPEEVALFHKSESGLVRDGVSKRIWVRGQSVYAYFPRGRVQDFDGNYHTTGLSACARETATTRRRVNFKGCSCAVTVSNHQTTWRTRATTVAPPVYATCPPPRPLEQAPPVLHSRAARNVLLLLVRSRLSRVRGLGQISHSAGRLKRSLTA